MSRAYRITVCESLRREIVAADEVRTRLELLAILTPEETAVLMKAELIARGFVETDDGTLTRQAGNTRVSVDPCSGDVAVKVEAKHDAIAERESVATAYDDVGPKLDRNVARVRAALREELEQKIDRESAKHQEEATRELETQLIELQPELAKIVNKITRDALKVKAARLGSVTEVLEDEATGSLTIKVEV